MITMTTHALPSNYIFDEIEFAAFFFFFFFSEDLVINQNGRRLLEFFIFNNLRICKGRVGADKGIGRFTFVGSTGCSVVNNGLVSSDVLHCLSHFEICPPNILSDHCAITFYITFLITKKYKNF